LDARYVGSAVLEEKRKYGKDGKYLAFVTGSLSNLSAGVYTFMEFIAGAQTTRALHWRSTSREQLFSMYRHFLVSSFCLFAARLWARHIHDRFRNAVAVSATCHAPLYSTLILRPFGTSALEGLAYKATVRALPESACFL
jgi:hypothetical protein